MSPGPSWPGPTSRTRAAGRATSSSATPIPSTARRPGPPARPDARPRGGAGPRVRPHRDDRPWRRRGQPDGLGGGAHRRRFRLRQAVRPHAGHPRRRADDPARPPAGVLIRPLVPGSANDLRLAHRIIEEAFVDSMDHQPIRYDAWRRRLATITWDEWFLAEVDGEPAGALQSAEPAEGTDEAWVRMLAVLRPYRRRGVGEALLRRALATYAHKGRTHAGLGVDLTNPTGPVRLYRAVGMSPAYEADLYERRVAAAGPQGAAVRVGRERSSAT